MKVSRTATERLLTTAFTARTVQGSTVRTGAWPAGDQPVVLGRYRLERRLGAGAFGTVWLARDERLDRDVAVKVLARERVLGGRFEREARAAARLSHPGIVTLYEAAVDDDGAYLVSELVRGETLERLAEAGRLSDRDVLQIGIALCDALAHAHAHGVVHRDVKPSNVLIPEQPPTSAQVAKLTDFGVARVIGGDSLTRTGEVIGTAAYMAPEQAEGLPAGMPADLYSLALVLYEALTGVNPVPGGSQRPRRLGALLPPLRRYRRDLPRELGRGIDLALRPRARERGTVEELRDALAQAADDVLDTPGVAESWGHPRQGVVGLRGSPGEDDLAQLDEALGAAWREPTDAPDERALARPVAGLRARLLAGVGAGLCAGWLELELVPRAPLGPAAAVLAGVSVSALPRLGWLAMAAAGCGTLLLHGSYGAAPLVGLGLLLPVLLLLRHGSSWSYAVAAPALGLLGLAGAWPALAARARSVWERAALGFLGWLWLLLAGAFAGRGLYVRLPAGVPVKSLWTPSLYDATHHVLAPLLTPGLVAPAAVWALAAAGLPMMRRPHSFRSRLLAATAWSTTTVLATLAVVALAGEGTGIAAGAGLLGALLAAAVAAISLDGRGSLAVRR